MNRQDAPSAYNVSVIVSDKKNFNIHKRQLLKKNESPNGLEPTSVYLAPYRCAKPADAIKAMREQYLVHNIILSAVFTASKVNG